MDKIINIFSKLPKDKLAHFFGGSVLFTTCMLVFSSDIPAVIITIATAILKEIVWDGLLKKGTLDVLDAIFSILPVLFYFLQ